MYIRNLLPTPTRIGFLRLFFPHHVSKTDAARITKLDIEMSYDHSWNPIYFGIKRSKVKVTSHTNITAWVFALLRVLASSLYDDYF